MKYITFELRDSNMKLLRKELLMSNEKIQISYLESNTVCTDLSPV